LQRSAAYFDLRSK